MTRPVPAWLRVLPHVWSALLPLLLLGPALKPGYVLTYDMVWVPELAMRSDFLGAGGGLPRAVPSDAVVAVLDNLVPGMVLQKLVLLGALVLVAQAVLRLVGPSVPGRLVAVSVAVWNPFVIERMLIGHWPVLLGYAVLPWLVVLMRRARKQDRFPAALWFLVPLGCLSASAGLMTALALAVLSVGLGLRTGHKVRLVVLAVAANAPWVVAGVLHASATSAQVGAQVFAPHAEGTMPAPLAALGLGGIWNIEVVPASRQGALAWIALVGLLLLSVAGARPWWRRTGGEDAARLVLLWAVGLGVAVLTGLAPALVDTFAGAIPGAGLLRDGSRYLALCLPLLVSVTAAGADALAGAMGSVTPRVATTVACTLFPVMVMSDAAWGGGGALTPAAYPSSWAKARAALAGADYARGGDVLVLPFTSYRAPAWNNRHKVLDPMGRYLTSNYVVNDELSVSGKRVPGDDPRVSQVRTGLDQPDPHRQAHALGRLGIRFVVEDLDARLPGEPDTPDVAGRMLFRDPHVHVIEVDAPVHSRSHSRAWWIALALAWAAYSGTLCAGLLHLVTRPRPMKSRARPIN